MHDLRLPLSPVRSLKVLIDGSVGESIHEYNRLLGYRKSARLSYTPQSRLPAKGRLHHNREGVKNLIDACEENELSLDEIFTFNTLFSTAAYWSLLWRSLQSSHQYRSKACAMTRTFTGKKLGCLRVCIAI